MTRYISDRDIAALAQGDQGEGYEAGFDDETPAISFKALAGITGGIVAAIIVTWVAVEQIGGEGPVPLVTASADPVKVRPQTPGGLEIPFQDMALYDSLDPSSGATPPVLTPSSEQPDRTVLAPQSANQTSANQTGVLQDGEVLSAQNLSAQDETQGASKPLTPAETQPTGPVQRLGADPRPSSVPQSSAQSPTQAPPQSPSLAQGEGESLFAALEPIPPLPTAEPEPEAAATNQDTNQPAADDGQERPAGNQPSVMPSTAAPSPQAPQMTPRPITVTVTDITAVDTPPTTVAGQPPVPPRHPTRGRALAAQQAQQQAESFFPPQPADSDIRRIRRGTIASQQVPLNAAQNGLQPGGALGLSDSEGNLVYRNNVRQTTTAPLPEGPVQGEVELVMQRPGAATEPPGFNQPPPISVTPEQPTRAADGTIEIRSPNRTPISIRSADQAQAQIAAAAQQPERPPVPSLIPQPPTRPVGPASGDELADGDQIAAANQAPPVPPRPLSQVNTLPDGARAPAPVSTGITRGTVVNQRAPAPGAPQAPVRDPVRGTGAAQANSQAPATMGQPAQPALQPTSVSNIPPRLTGQASQTSSQAPSEAPGSNTSAVEGWRVQLASVGSQEAAMGEWRRFQRANSDLLGNLNLKIQRADLGARGTFYRVQAGVLDRNGADRVCQALKSRGTDCLITRD
ncbi:MAG: SPOR domain-containing protein [Pseudomonadota bacterium]